MKAQQFQKTATEAQLKYGLGDPVAIVYLYPGDVFVKGGDRNRDREEISSQLIKCAADELDDRPKERA